MPGVNNAGGPRRRTAGAGRSASRGFTLTELMISLLLGLFTISGVLIALLGGVETFRTTDSLSRIQETGRFALEILRRDIREAGYNGCRGSLRAEVPRPPAAVTPLDVDLVRNTLNPAPVSAADNLSPAYNFAEPLQGYEATGTGGGSSWTAGDATMPVVGANALITNARDDSDVLLAVVPRGPGVAVVAPTLPVVGPDFEIAVDAGSGIAAGDVIMLTDCARAAITQVTGVAGGTLLSHAIGPAPATVDAENPPGNYKIDLGGAFGIGSEVFPIERVAFYVADSPVTGRPSLFRNGQEIAMDVEDFQVEYGVDTNGDLRVDQYVNAAGMLTVATLGPAWENVVVVRVHLRISSGEENNLSEVPVTLNYAGTTFTAPAGDLRLHQVFTSTIGIRNRLR